MNKKTKNYDSLESLHAQFQDDSIFVIGNGPSLSKTPLDLLDSEYSFALNSINLIYKDVEWRPDFYIFIKSSMNAAEQEMVEENINLGCVCFLNKKYRERFGDNENVFYIERRKLSADPLSLATSGKSDIETVETDTLRHYWSDDITQGVYKQHSMYPLLQIVKYLGFNTVYLFGCDLGFDVQKPYMLFDHGHDPSEFRDKIDFVTTSFKDRNLFSSIGNGIAFKLMQTRPIDYVLRQTTNLYEDSNHFTESYDGKIQYMNVNKQISNAHRVAQKILNEKGIKVYNATLGGELEVYPRVNLEHLFDQNKYKE